MLAVIAAEDYARLIPLAYGAQLLPRSRGNQIVQRTGAVARELPVLVTVVIENLILESERRVIWRLGDGEFFGDVVLDPAVRARRDFPLPGQLEVGETVHRHEITAGERLPVRQRGHLAARDLLDRAVLDHPVSGRDGVVAQPAPADERPAVEQQLPPRVQLGCSQLIGLR